MILVERKLFKYYFFASLLFVFFIVAFSVPWGHWAYDLDRCTGFDCGCVLYMKSYAEVTTGGPIEYCQFVTFAQIPLLVISVVLTFYHGVRAYIKPRREARKNAWRGNPLLAGSRTRRPTSSERNLTQLELEPPTKAGTIALVATSIVVLAVLLTVFGFFTDGFFESCKESRRTIVKYLGASSRVAHILNQRLICPSIFDFIDYLLPERRRPNEVFEFKRREPLNTGLSLVLALVSLLMNVFSWIVILILNFKLLFGRLRTSTAT